MTNIYMATVNFLAVKKNSEYEETERCFIPAKDMASAVKVLQNNYGDDIIIRHLESVPNWGQDASITEDEMLKLKIADADMPIIYAIGGTAGSGKDFVATRVEERIHELYPKQRVLVTHLADLLKYFMRNYEGWNGEKDEAGRSRLQELGTDIVRNWDSTYWVRRLIEIIYFYRSRYDIVIIPDIRFTNEIDTLKYMLNTKYIYVKGGYNETTLTERQLRHKSENSLYNEVSGYVIEPDYVINNSKKASENDLEKVIKEIIT